MPRNACEAKLRSLDDIFTDAMLGRFNESEYRAWQKEDPLALAYYTAEGGNSFLHFAALSDAAAVVGILLEAGADPHRINDDGKTPFNFAAQNSPGAGRRMTLHWYAQAKRGDGLGLNAGSGNHRTPLIQYAAKWCNADTIREMIETEHEIKETFPEEDEDGVLTEALEEQRVRKERVDPFVVNDSGWSPLHAAACMPNRAQAVAVIARAYEKEPEFLFLRTTQTYTATYRSSKGGEAKVTYPVGSTAIDLINCRLEQDRGLTHREKESLRDARQLIGESQHRAAPDSAAHEIF